MLIKLGTSKEPVLNVTLLRRHRSGSEPELCKTWARMLCSIMQIRTKTFLPFYTGDLFSHLSNGTNTLKSYLFMLREYFLQSSYQVVSAVRDTNECRPVLQSL